MIITNSTKHILLCFLILSITFAGIWYTISIQKNTVLEITTDRSKILISSSEVLCHPPNNTSFTRDRLKQLIVKRLENRSAYVEENDASKVTYISKNYSTLTEFIKTVVQPYCHVD
jgi:hypothetical protein